jgi:DinB family protein
MDYTKLSLSAIEEALEQIARDATTTFGDLDARQLNWRPDPARWSVAQCFEHLLVANELMFRAVEAALDPAEPRTIWQRLPVLPRLLGRMLIRSQAPGATRRFTASSKATPASSDIPPDVVSRFVEQHLQAVSRIQTLDEREATRAILTSPFVHVITYSVLDGWRLVAAHDRRHFEQARRVLLSPGFPYTLSAG